MSQDQPSTTTRRTVLAGALGLAGAAFLAACGKDDPAPGISGQVVPSTSTPPTVPVTTPSTTALADEKTQLETAQSLELLVAEFYSNHIPKLTDQDLAAEARRFRSAHTEAAAAYAEAVTDPVEGADKPNEYLKTELIAPVEGQLTNDVAIVAFFHDLESTIAATAINAVSIYTTTEWRQRSMTFGAASARRATILADAAAGAAPTEPLYPLTDLIPGAAFLGVKKDAAS